MRAGGLAAKARYRVFQAESQWVLSCGEHRLARYPDQMSAVSAGRRAAFHAIGSGFDPELVIMEGDQALPAEPASFAPSSRPPAAWS